MKKTVQQLRFGQVVFFEQKGAFDSSVLCPSKPLSAVPHNLADRASIVYIVRLRLLQTNLHRWLLRTYQ